VTYLIAALLLTLPTIGLAQQIAIGQYQLPTTGGTPSGIAAGPDGALWFTEYGNAHKIGRITTAGAITEYPVPTADSKSEGIVAGPDGALWFTEYDGNNIGRITTSGVVNEYPIPTAFSDPEGIAAGPDGALWFTEWNGNKIGRITTSGAITEYALPNAASGPKGITAGPDDALWFTETTGSRIGRITTAGAIAEYHVPMASCCPPSPRDPNGITAGSDGALWFTEWNINEIGRITTAGAITEYPVPGISSDLDGITAGPDGALWFTEHIYNFSFYGQIGRMTTGGVCTGYPVPTANNPIQIAAGPDGEMWFTSSGDQIGEAVFVTADLSVSPASSFYQTELTFTGTMFAPNENVQIYLRGVGSAVLAGAIADSTGSFTVSVPEPQSPYGPRLFLRVGQSSGKLGAASFSVTPGLMLNPSSGSVGSTAKVQGYGFGAFEGVELYWSDPQVSLGFATANIDGTFNGGTALKFTIPAGAASGQNTVFGIGQKTGARGSGSFTVQ
jgi:streptogramin lyase